MSFHIHRNYTTKNLETWLVQHRQLATAPSPKLLRIIDTLAIHQTLHAVSGYIYGHPEHGQDEGTQRGGVAKK